MAQVAKTRQPATAGVIAATLTPMRADGTPNPLLMHDHCKALRADGCSSVVVLGTTGEANSFTIAERKEILEALINDGISPGDLIVGTGCCAHGDTVDLTRHALSLNVDRVLMLPPFYYKGVSDDGLFDAFARAIESVAESRLRVYLYLIPQMSGVEIGVELIERLLDAYPQTIAGLKDSSGDWPSTEVLCRRLRDRMDVLVGTERLLLRALRAGASGCVSATANVNAVAISRLFDQRLQLGAAQLEARINAKRAVFERYPMIPALKAYLAAKTSIIAWNNLRAPLMRLSQGEVQDLIGAADRADSA